jgi:hypothetical protein
MGLIAIGRTNAGSASRMRFVTVGHAEVCWWV